MMRGEERLKAKGEVARRRAMVVFGGSGERGGRVWEEGEWGVCKKSPEAEGAFSEKDKRKLVAR